MEMESSPVTGNGSANGQLFKFPAFPTDFPGSADNSPLDDHSPFTSAPPPDSGSGRWQPRRNSRANRWTNGSAYPTGRHGRQKSLSEAIRTIRTRRGSVSQNAMEIADALKAPVSPALVTLFSIWYFASVMSTTSSKQILQAFPKPVTLTIVQFIFVSIWCLLLSSLSSRFPVIKAKIPALKNGIVPPTRDIIITTLPITAFMIGGHILSSDAISRIPVSLVHTIKGLSPLFTVFAYRFFYQIRYSIYTYLSLVPLTIGVVLACSTDFSSNFLGLLSAFASAILFVTQNIVSKKIFNEAALAEKEPQRTKKPDKLNLLCYSSLMALIITAPIWLWSEGWFILRDFLADASVELSGGENSFDHGRLGLEYLFNGTFHFTQSLSAFVLLSMVSPVTYSVASLVKRVFVIVFSLIWFGTQVTRIQGYGICLTFLGLYLYDRTSDADKADRKARLQQFRDHAAQPPLLPLFEGPIESSPPSASSWNQSHGNGGHVSPTPRDNAGPANGWLAPGTKAQETWMPEDSKGNILGAA